MNRDYTPRVRKDNDLHHPMFPRKYHRETYPQAKYIADIVVVRDMWRPIHDALHAEVSPVPALGYYSLCSIARDIKPYYETGVEAIDDYSSLVEQAARAPKCRAGEAALNLLHIETLREQLPFIQDADTLKLRRAIA